MLSSLGGGAPPAFAARDQRALSSSYPAPATLGPGGAATAPMLAASLMDSVMSPSKRPRIETNELVVNALTSNNKGLFANVPIHLTGYQTTDSHPDQIITQSIMIKPYRQNWQCDFLQNTSLFVHRMDTSYDCASVHTVASVPVLNYFNELRSTLDELDGAALVVAQRDLQLNGAHLGWRHADDFARNWNWLGNVSSRMEASNGGAPSSAARPGQRTLGFSTWGRSHAYNLFGENIKRGNQLFFVTKHYNVSASRALLDPEGNAMPGRTQYDTCALQVRGFTDSERPPADSSCEDVASFTLKPSYVRSPLETSDADYLARNERIVNEYTFFDWSTAPDGADADDDDALPHEPVFRVRNLLDQEGMQAALQSVPDLVYDAYHTGHVQSVGMARQLQGTPCGEHVRLTAHRNHKVMHKLPVVELYAGI